MSMQTYQEIRAELEAAPENATLTRMLDGVSLTCSPAERAAILNDRAQILFSTHSVPVALSFRSLAFALQQAGLYEQARDVALATTSGEIWWNTAQSDIVRRDHPFVAALATAVGLTSDQLDAIFIAAKAL